jgi:hypothetical protein
MLSNWLFISLLPSTSLARLLSTPEIYGFGNIDQEKYAQIAQLESRAEILDECQSAVSNPTF